MRQPIRPAPVELWFCPREVFDSLEADGLHACRHWFPWPGPVSIENAAKLTGQMSAEPLVVIDTPGCGPAAFRAVASRFNALSTEEYFARNMGRLPIATISPAALERLRNEKDSIGIRIARRSMDVGMSLTMGLVFVIALLPIALLIRIDSTGPIFYTQERVGRGGKVYRIYKLRTMYVGAELHGPQFAALRDVRITRVGRLLRRSRIDELPQLVNVIRGEMSIIGPRPERPEWVHYFRRVIEGYDVRYSVRPGITGWAQIHEGYGDSVDAARRKLERDLYYLRNRSIWLDVRIAARTVLTLARLRGQ